jgi:hypothetical protein
MNDGVKNNIFLLLCNKDQKKIDVDSLLLMFLPEM